METMHLTIIGIVIAALVWWFFIRNMPRVMPLVVDKNDPLMIEAIKKAKSSIGELKKLFKQYPQSTNVKVEFVTNSGEKEFLWAELLSVDGENMNVRLTTPPISHSGKLERLHTFPFSNIVDWAVTTSENKIKGGFCERVMFVRYKEKYGELPKILAKQEANFE